MRQILREFIPRLGLSLPGSVMRRAISAHPLQFGIVLRINLIADAIAAQRGSITLDC